MAERLAASSAVRLRPPAGLARRGAARRGARARRHRLHQGEPALLPEQGAGRAPARLRRHRQQRPGRPRVDLRRADPRHARARSSSRPTRGGTPSAASSGRRPPATALELTIDEYLQHIAERELRAGVAENRAAGGTRDHHGSADRRDPRAGELADVQPERVQRVATSARRNRAVQDLYEPGSTFKVVTASAAIEEGRHQPDRSRSTAARATSRSAAASIRDTHDYGVLSFTDVIVEVEQRRRDQDRAAGSAPSGSSRYVSRFGFGQPLVARFPRREPGIVWNPAKLDDSALASVSMGYQVGVTPLQMAAAVSSVANGGELVEPRVVRAFIRNGRRDAVPPQGRAPRDHAGDRGDADRRSWKASSSAAPAKRAQIDGYTIAGKTGTAAKLVNGRYSKSDYNASFVGFVPSRKPALTIIVVIDSPHARRLLRRRRRGADLQAHRRSDAAASRRRADASTRRRRCSSRATTTPARTGRSGRRGTDAVVTRRSPTARPGRCPICAA